MEKKTNLDCEWILEEKGGTMMDLDIFHQSFLFA